MGGVLSIGFSEGDPYRRMGVNPRAPARGLNKPVRDKSNPRDEKEIKYSTCRGCGKLFKALKNSFYCDACRSKKNNSQVNIRNSKQKNKQKFCKFCGLHYPKSKMANSEICIFCSARCKSCDKIFPKSELGPKLICKHCSELKKEHDKEFTKSYVPKTETPNVKQCKACQKLKKLEHFTTNNIEHDLCDYCREKVECSKCKKVQYRFQFFKAGIEKNICIKCLNKKAM